MFHHSFSVKFRSKCLQFFGYCQLRNACFEFVHTTRQRPSFFLISCRAVAASEHIEFVEKFARVSYVTTNRRITPTEAIRVESKMKRNKLCDRLNVLI